MQNFNWYNELDAAITVCDIDGIILEMNEKASVNFEKWGGKSLIGKSLYDCHKEVSNEKIKKILDTQKPNIYTTEKNEIKRIVIQKPWFENKTLKGIAELVFEIPFEMPHFDRN
jgi:transcriptional regulator with PAS, ATPase and Fis domain